MSAEPSRALRLPRRTERLQIREFTAEDEASLVALYTDRRVTRHLLYGPGDADGAREHLARILRRQRLRRRDTWELAVELAGTGGLVGAGDLVMHSAEEAEIGYLVAHAHWGHGYATELAAGLLEAAFTDLGAQRVIATVEIANARSIAVLDKLGLRWEGSFRRHARARKRWWDVHLHALSREDWLQAQA